MSSLDDVMTRWGVTHPLLIAETGTSFVYRVAVAGGVAVLKLLKPDGKADEARGGALMRWYDGDGAARVYQSDEDAVLMQWLDGETLGDVARAGDDAGASAILCQVLARLHAPRSAQQPVLLPLRERFASLFMAAPGTWPYHNRSSVYRATGLADALLDSNSDMGPLHGDMHHDNVIRAGDRWLAIDPKGLLGDRGYDYASSFLNPMRAEVMVTDPVRLRRHAAIVADHSGISRERILCWTAAHAALSAAWDLEDGKPIARQMAVLELVLAEIDADW